MQIFTEKQADGFSFDVLDATKIVPEELVPIKPVGRMVLDRNPDNFFAETEQVAFCTAHIVPGLDFSNDPLLAGRIHSYVDTQITRLGGPNFHEIPINASIAQVHNNQRDGMHRQAIHRGRAAYEPNSLGGGCPFQAGMRGFVSFPAPVAEDKVRGKPERFADHYTQATLFWDSQSAVEKAHIIRAFRFELTRVQTAAIRERVVSMLANVADELAEGVAAGLGIDVPTPMPKVLSKVAKAGSDVVARAFAFCATRRWRRQNAAHRHSRRGRRRWRVARRTPHHAVRRGRRASLRRRATRPGSIIERRCSRCRSEYGSGARGAFRCARVARRRRGDRSAWPRWPCARVPQGPVSSLQADPPAGRGRRSAREGRHRRQDAVRQARSRSAAFQGGRRSPRRRPPSWPPSANIVTSCGKRTRRSSDLRSSPWKLSN